MNESFIEKLAHRWIQRCEKLSIKSAGMIFCASWNCRYGFEGELEYRSEFLETFSWKAYIKQSKSFGFF